MVFALWVTSLVAILLAPILHLHLHQRAPCLSPNCTP
jgi:hypothetical protein